jgi:hypothetical protein
MSRKLNLAITTFVAKLHTLATESDANYAAHYPEAKEDHTSIFTVEYGSRWATIRRGVQYHHVIGNHVYAKVALRRGVMKLSGVDFEIKVGDVCSTSFRGMTLLPVLGSIYAENIKAFTGYYDLARPFEVERGQDCWERRYYKPSSLEAFEGGYRLKQV